MEFRYCSNPRAEVPIIRLTDDIGVDPETGKGIDGAIWQEELMRLDILQPRSIEVWINSAGGNVDAGYNIHGTILLTKTPVDTVNLGMAASIAAVIFQGGRKRIMMDYSWLMYHNPFGGDDKKLLGVMKSSIGTMIARSGKSEAEILDMMKKETFIYAKEAKEMGFCDEVRNSSDHNKKRLVFSGETTGISNFHKEANLVLNKILETPNNKKMSFKLVTNKLGLNEDATEDNILKAIEKIQNKAKSDMDVAEDKVKSAKDALKAAEDERDALKKEKDALVEDKKTLTKEKDEIKNKVEGLEKEKAEAEDKALTEKCKNMVEGFAKVGRIKNDAKTIGFWTELAKSEGGFDIVKDQIEALPLNKIAPVITLEKDTKPTYTMAGAMGIIANKLAKSNN